jgi:CysZ protein
MENNFVTGFHFFIKGIKLVLSPGLKRFIIIPIIINFFLFIGLILFLYSYVSDHFHAVIGSYPGWLTMILGWLFSFLFWAASFLFSTFLFTILTNIIASPFYGLLAEKTERQLSTSKLKPSDLSLWALLPRTLAREARKLIYFMPWLLLCLILFIFPPTLPFAPFVWWIVLSWLLGVQYLDYVADNQQYSLKKMLKILKKVPFTILGFGGTVTLCMSIPGGNLIVPPAAVAGGVALWLALINPVDHKAIK